MRIFFLLLGLLALSAYAQWPTPMDHARLSAYTDSSRRRDTSVRYIQDWETVLERQSPFYAKLFPFLREQNIYFYQYALHFIDNTQGMLAPFQRTPDKGVLVFCARRKGKKNSHPIPYIAKFDSNLTLQWERYYEKKGLGIQSYEAHGGGICPDGKTYVAMMQPYTNRSENPMQWLMWLDSTGRILREAMLPGKGGTETPSIRTLQMNAQCGLQMEGHIYLSEREREEEYDHAVFYKFNSRGVMLYDSIGPAVKY